MTFVVTLERRGHISTAAIQIGQNKSMVPSISRAGKNGLWGEEILTFSYTRQGQEEDKVCGIDYGILNENKDTLRGKAGVVVQRLGLCATSEMNSHSTWSLGIYDKS